MSQLSQHGLGGYEEEHLLECIAGKVRWYWCCVYCRHNPCELLQLLWSVTFKLYASCHVNGQVYREAYTHSDPVIQVGASAVVKPGGAYM